MWIVEAGTDPCSGTERSFWVWCDALSSSCARAQEDAMRTADEGPRGLCGQCRTTGRHALPVASSCPTSRSIQAARLRDGIPKARATPNAIQLFRRYFPT